MFEETAKSFGGARFLSAGEVGKRIAQLACESAADVRRRECDEWDVRELAEAFEESQKQLLQLAYVDVGQAERLAQCGELLAERLGDSRSLGMAARGWGHIHYVRGAYREANAAYERSTYLLAAAGDTLELGRTLSSGIQTLIYLSRYDEALEWAGRAKEIFTRSGDALRLARLASNTGNIWYRQDKYELALASYEEAQRNLLGLGQPSDVAAAMSNGAVCRISLGLFREALQDYEQLREYCGTHGLTLLTAAADYNIAYLYFLCGDYAVALGLYRQTREHCQAVKDPYHAALCDLDESEMLLELNLLPDAGQTAMAAAEAFGALGMRYEQAKALSFAGLAAARRRQRAIANRFFQQAEGLFRRDGNKLWLATLNYYRALALEVDGKVTAALEQCRRATGAYRRAGVSYRQFASDLLRARLYLRRGDWRSAERCLPSIEGELAAPALHQIHLLQGDVEAVAGRPEAAISSYGKARLILEQLRGRTSTEDQRLAFVEDRGEVYEKLALLLMQAGAGERDEDVFHLLEQARSRTLFEAVFAGVEEERTQDPELRLLWRELNACYRRIDTVRWSKESDREAIVAPLRARAKEYEAKVERSLAANASRSSRDVLDARGALTATSMREALPAGTTLLEFALLGDQLYACVLNEESVRIVALGLANEVRRTVQLLLFQMGRKGLSVADQQRRQAAVDDHLRVLYERLIAPVDGLLHGAKLLIVPHRFLHQLPFHALRGEAGYLTEQFEIQYAPSGSVFAACSARRQPVGGPALVMGFSDSAAPWIQWEAERVAAALPAVELRMAGEATREAFRRAAPRCDVLHLATHAVFRPDNVLFSALRLADGYLGLWELKHIPLRARLAVLSGCGTGLNLLTGGDELIGFVRGFLAAGANQVVASLWDVHDESTAHLMGAFYERWKVDWDGAAAMRYAMGETRKKYTDPAHWAPFQVWGGKNA